jgi:hypothetical protein
MCFGVFGSFLAWNEDFFVGIQKTLYFDVYHKMDGEYNPFSNFPEDTPAFPALFPEKTRFRGVFGGANGKRQSQISPGNLAWIRGARPNPN